MSKGTTQERLATKTPEAAFLHVLQKEFNFSTRVSRELLNTAQEMLVGGTPSSAVRPGQVRLVVVSLKAPFGPPLVETDKVEVTLTVDAGAEDAVIKAREGSAGLRQGRILRLLEEALEQGGVLTQEDLARALNVDVRTIRRDVRILREEGHLVHSRGQLKGVGRGQTHKVRIIELWLDREGYEKISRWLHHSPQAIKRYVSTFLRIVVLHRQGTPAKEIAFLTQSSVRLVKDYLAVYEAALAEAHRREKLEEELARVSGWQQASGTGRACCGEGKYASFFTRQTTLTSPI
jgi:DNA-binding Lrp family transcriptional regulator